MLAFCPLKQSRPGTRALGGALQFLAPCRRQRQRLWSVSLPTMMRMSQSPYLPVYHALWPVPQEEWIYCTSSSLAPRSLLVKKMPRQDRHHPHLHPRGLDLGFLAATAPSFLLGALTLERRFICPTLMSPAKPQMGDRVTCQRKSCLRFGLKRSSPDSCRFRKKPLTAIRIAKEILRA